MQLIASTIIIYAKCLVRAHNYGHPPDQPANGISTRPTVMRSYMYIVIFDFCVTTGLLDIFRFFVLCDFLSVSDIDKLNFGTLVRSGRQKCAKSRLLWVGKVAGTAVNGVGSSVVRTKSV